MSACRRKPVHERALDVVETEFFLELLSEIAVPSSATMQ